MPACNEYEPDINFVIIVEELIEREAYRECNSWLEREADVERYSRNELTINLFI